MKIAVCFKIMADYARLSQEDWTWDERHFVDTGFVRRIFNCYDESALEMALKLAVPLDKQLVKADLTAFTVDDVQSELFLKQLLAVGYDHAVRIECNRDIDLRFNPSAVSSLIAEYVKQEGQQLVLLGIQGGDGDNCQTGPLVAERLGWPCIREVTQVVRTKDPDTLKVFSRIDRAALVQIVRLPMVLTIGQCQDSPYLRFPSLKKKLMAKKKPVIVLSPNDLQMDNDTWAKKEKTLLSLAQPRAKQSCVFFGDKSPSEQARQLYYHYLKTRLNL